MSNRKISDLDKKTPENSFEFIVAQGNSNFKVTFADIKSVIASSANFNNSNNDQENTNFNFPDTANNNTDTGVLTYTVDEESPYIRILSSTPPSNFYTGSVYEVTKIRLTEGLVTDLQVINNNGARVFIGYDHTNRGTDWEVVNVVEDLGATINNLDQNLNSLSVNLEDFKNQTIASLTAQSSQVEDAVRDLSVNTFTFISSVENNSGPEFLEYKTTPSPNTLLSKVYVESADNLRVKVRWDGPFEDYTGKGSVKIGGAYQDIPAENVIELGEYTRRFEGFIDGNFIGENKIFAISDGSEYSVDLVELGPGPVPTEIIFVNTQAAPGTDLGTSALKEGDIVEVEATFDISGYASFDLQKPNKIIVLDKGLAKPSNIENLVLQDTGDQNIKKLSFSFEVSNRNGDLSLCIQAVNVAGIVGAEFCSDTRTADSNAPVVVFTSIDYPVDQQAIKNTDTAVVNHTITDADVFVYEGTNLSIENPSVFETAKNVTNASGYEISSDNFKVTATKTSNGLSVESSTLVKIADDPIVLEIDSLPNNIQSSPQGFAHSFTLKGSQKFLEVPTLTLDPSQNPISSISQSSNGTDERSNKFILTVTDGDEVGSFNWSVTSKNLAGILTTSVSPASYNIQGFSERTLTATKDSLAQGLSNNIGVSVFDPSNLSFENLSKGGSAQNGGTIFTYKSFSAGTKMDFLVNFTNQFTVCDSDGTFNPNGEYLFNLDKLNRDSNSDKNNPAQFIVRED